MANGWTIWTRDKGRIRSFSIGEPDRMKARELLKAKIPGQVLVSDQELPATVVQMLGLGSGSGMEWVPLDPKETLTPGGTPIS